MQGAGLVGTCRHKPVTPRLEPVATGHDVLRHPVEAKRAARGVDQDHADRQPIEHLLGGIGPRPQHIEPQHELDGALQVRRQHQQQRLVLGGQRLGPFRLHQPPHGAVVRLPQQQSRRAVLQTLRAVKHVVDLASVELAPVVELAADDRHAHRLAQQQGDARVAPRAGIFGVEQGLQAQVEPGAGREADTL